MRKLLTLHFVHCLFFILVLSHCAFASEEQYIAESFGFYSRGVEYYHKGKLYEAREALSRAVKLDPKNEEAATYLELVNAELKLRAKGEFSHYEREQEFRRESNGIVERKPTGEIVTYKPPRGPQPEFEYPPKYEEAPPEGYLPEDRVKIAIDSINEQIKPAKISGGYKMSLGFTTEDVIWKYANGDLNERNWRMIDEKTAKINTFDPRVYDRLKIVADTQNKAGLNFHTDISIDPWSFVGKTDKFTVSTASDKTEMELKYWSNTRRTINETIPTLTQGDAIALPEIKVVDGKITPTTVADTFGETFSIPEMKIHDSFQPIRELWFDYSKDSYKFRVFPFVLETQAFSSDDPFGLSNHHIYWEPSPWLDEWKPGNFNSGATPTASFTRGEWSDDLSFFTRDSDLTRLTALRGFSFEGEFVENTSLNATLATPKTLWQDYGSVTSIPGAMRIKHNLSDEIALGTIYTFRVGYNEEKRDSVNNVLGIDASFKISPDLKILTEVAASRSNENKSSAYKVDSRGNAWYLGLENEAKGFEVPLKTRFSYAHMDKGFDPGLSSYRETRRDQFWSRHIHFKLPYAYLGPHLSYYDIEPFRIGDGIDVGRDAVRLQLEAKELFDKRLDNLIDFRNVHQTNDKYVESVFRNESTYRINPEWTSKFLFIYHDLPKTKAGIDPILYDADTGEFLTNSAIEDGKDPSISTYSAGLQYRPSDFFSIYGIYENTNDFTFATANHPRGLLNSTSFTQETIEGQVIRKEVPYLYSQNFFDLPPYQHFNIYRTGIGINPTKDLGIELDFTKNDFKYAAGIDDNINHFGLGVRYNFNKRLSGYLKYTYSKAYNLFKQNTSGELSYEDHHNVFMEFDYSVTEYGQLVIQFGEGAFISPVWGITASPFGDFLPTLDTQHILRIYYNGRF